MIALGLIFALGVVAFTWVGLMGAWNAYMASIYRLHIFLPWQEAIQRYDWELSEYYCNEAKRLMYYQSRWNPWFWLCHWRDPFGDQLPRGARVQV